MELAFAGDVSIPNTSHINLPRKKRLREPENDNSSPASSASSPPLSPIEGSNRSIAGSRRVSQAELKQLALFSLPMYSNELGRLPIYGQFNFSDSNACLPPQSSSTAATASAPTNFDQIILSNLASTPSGGVPMADTDAYVLDGLFNGQTMQNFANHTHTSRSQQQQQSATAADIASFFAGTSSDFEGLSRFGTMPAMDNDTMTMWSTAPTGLEYALFLFSWLVWCWWRLLDQDRRLELVFIECWADYTGSRIRPSLWPLSSFFSNMSDEAPKFFLPCLLLL